MVQGKPGCRLNLRESPRLHLTAGCLLATSLSLWTSLFRRQHEAPLGFREEAIQQRI